MKIKHISVIWFFGVYLTALLSAQSYSVHPLGIAARAQDLAVDNNGNLHLVWVTATSEIRYGRIVPDGSGGYMVTGQQLVVAANAKVSQFTRPRMAVRPDGSTVHVVYLESDQAVKHSWRNSSGVWSTEYVRNNGANYAFPSIGVNAVGTLHFIAQRWGRTSPIIYLKKYVGGAWSADVAITDTAVEYRDCAMFTDSAGGVHATWHAGNRDGYYRYAPQGKGLNEVGTLQIPRREGVSTNSFGDLAVRYNGEVHAAFATWGTEQATIDHSYRPSGGAFQVPTCASGGTIDYDDLDCWPAVVAGAERIYVAWAESLSGGTFSKVKLSVRSGSAWTPYTVDATAAVYPYSKPSMAQTGAGVFGVWRSNMFAAGQLLLGVLPPDVPKTIAVTSPNGGESWMVGTSHDITWSSTGAIENVLIGYSANNGSTWTNVTPETPNDGRFSWTVPDAVSAGCRVRVMETDGSPLDASNAAFSIIPVPPPVISGTVRLDGVALAGVTLGGLPGDPVSGAAGAYAAAVSSGWSGTVTPVLAGYTFTPSSREYAGVVSDQPSQDFAATPVPYTLSGTVTAQGVPLAGVTLDGLPGDPLTGEDGTYTATVFHGWSGTATPRSSGCLFVPAARTYAGVTGNQAGQDFRAIAVMVLHGHDFNGSGGSDIAIFRLGSAGWYLKGIGTYFWGNSGDKPVNGDYDADGTTDIAVFQPAAGQWVARLSGGGTMTVAWGGSNDIPVPADYDGDGKTDVAVFRPATGEWRLKYSAGGTAQFTLGGADDVPVPGDYGGDGKADAAVWHPATGKWDVRYSNGSTATIPWGASGDIPVPADYDGDGVRDMAVWTPASGKWSLRYSGGGTATVIWGAGTDIPAPGDYDADGKADAAVWRIANGMWYVKYSGGGAMSAGWGGSGDTPLVR